MFHVKKNIIGLIACTFIVSSASAANDTSSVVTAGATTIDLKAKPSTTGTVSTKGDVSKKGTQGIGGFGRRLRTCRVRTSGSHRWKEAEVGIWYRKKIEVSGFANTYVKCISGGNIYPVSYKSISLRLKGRNDQTMLYLANSNTSSAPSVSVSGSKRHQIRLSNHVICGVSYHSTLTDGIRYYGVARSRSRTCS